MKKIIGILLLVVTFGCNEGTNECKDISCEIDRTKSEVISMHDAVMARMGEIRSLKSSLSSADSLATDEEHAKFVELINQLDGADKEMWDWMHSFNYSYKGATDSLTLKYFEDQLESIKKVESSIDSAIKKGKAH